MRIEGSKRNENLKIADFFRRKVRNMANRITDRYYKPLPTAKRQDPKMNLTENKEAFQFSDMAEKVRRSMGRRLPEID